MNSAASVDRSSDRLTCSGYILNAASTVLHVNQPYRPPEHFHEVYAHFIDSDLIAKTGAFPESLGRELGSKPGRTL